MIDNASGDGTVDLVRERHPDVHVVANDQNVGFARATNSGIRAGDSPYVLALNPDTELQAGTLEHLVALLEEHPEIGIAGCRLVRPDGSLDHASRRSFPTVVGALAHFTGLGRRASGGRLAQYRAPEVERGPVDAVNGAFMLMRRAALDQVGLFDEGYWMYMEDLDLCYRFAQAGWVTWYEPDVEARHVKGGTTGGVRDARLTYAFHYGMWRFYRRHYAPQRNPLVNALVLGGITAKLALALAVPRLRRTASALAPPRR